MEQRRSFLLNREDYAKQYLEVEQNLKAKANLQWDSHDVELRVISNVFAYFDVASKRLIEAIPMLCEVVFAQGLDEKLRLPSNLTGKLQLIGERGRDTCANYLREDPVTREQRKRLEDMETCVDKSLALLNGG